MENVRYQGLNDAQVAQNREKFGPNLLAPPPRKPWWKELLAKFDDPVIRILMIAALISICTSEWVEGIGIIIAIILATGLAFLNEFRAARAFDILNKVNDDIPVKVIRNGLFQTVPKQDLVVGDVVWIEMGEEIPADGRILECVNLQIDQSKLTGESEPVRKMSSAEAAQGNHDAETYPPDMLLRGTPVCDGHGLMELTAVGAGTEIGKTATAAAEETHEATPLNLQLERLGQGVGLVGFSVSALTFLILVIHGWWEGAIVQSTAQWAVFWVLLLAVMTALSRVWLPVLLDGLSLAGVQSRKPVFLRFSAFKGGLLCLTLGVIVLGAGLGGLYWADKLPAELIAPDAWRQFVTFFMVAVTLIVMAVPEGLAMSVTLSLAYSMRKMTASNNLVRKMHACETIGAATVICTDKTGTLTLNQMRLQQIVAPDCPREFFAMAVAANSTAHLSFTSAEPSVIGNPTEGALLLDMYERGEDYEVLRSAFSVETQWTFSTERKFMATQGSLPDSKGKILFAKGAPEIVLGRCMSRMGSEARLTDSERQSILAELHAVQSRGMRTLGFAFVRDPADHSEVSEVAVDMVWMGFAAIADPVRADVPDAVCACRQAGIAVKMVTGDTPETAKEIGRQIQLWDDALCDSEQLMTGVEFAALSDEEALRKAKTLKIMARARPNDKLRLVKCLKQLGQIVAVTGDGTNDAPALNYADVGISMGKTGTAIAKEASDIILLDDSFKSIVNAVMWGRSLYRNIQKFILFQLTVNVVALTLAVTGPFIGIDLPLTVIQVLWINLIMDTFAALALATDPPDPQVMTLPPRRNTDFIVTPSMFRGIFGAGILFLAGLFGMLFYMEFHSLGDDPRWLTLFFTTLVMMQFWNLFNAKGFGSHESVIKKCFDNPVFLGIAGVIFVSQIVMVQFGGELFRTVPLSLNDWLIVILSTSVILFGGELLRVLKRRR